jgi:SAM-dependent methyltransferase
MIKSILFDSNHIIKTSLLKSIKKNCGSLTGKLLDFGCGNKPYDKLFEVDEYIGLDIIESGHNNSNKKADVFYDGKNIPFANDNFDSIFCSEVFEHVFNLDEVIKELNRVLKIDGKILLTIPFVWELHEKPFDFARYTVFGINSVLEKNGFEILKSEQTTNYIETLTQLKANYLAKLLYTKNGKINGIINLIFIFPLVLSGKFLSLLLPENKDLYLNNLVLARKINQC